MPSIKELIERLDERLIMGEISEQLYYQLKEKLEAKLKSSDTNAFISSSPQQPSSPNNQSHPAFDNMFMSGNPDGIGNQGSQESVMNSASGSSSGSGWQANAGIELQPGDKLGDQFTITKYLSKGGFGSVYQAHDSLRDKHIALKVIFPELSKADSALKQLINECDSRSRISNRRHILDVSTPLKFTFKNLAVIALPMELATGGNFRDYLNSKPSDISEEDWERQSIHFFKEACKGVKAIHRAGFTHQDVKPDNLLICKDPDTGKQILKVADFGLAKAKNKVQGLKRGAGTPAYMSPEQFDARVKDLKPSSDIYSLGCVLFELFDEDPPFECSDREEYKRQHKDKIPVMDFIPNKYKLVIQKCLEKDSDDRYPDAGDLLEAIEEIPRLEEAKRQDKERYELIKELSKLLLRYNETDSWPSNALSLSKEIKERFIRPETKALKELDNAIVTRDSDGVYDAFSHASEKDRDWFIVEICTLQNIRYSLRKIPKFIRELVGMTSNEIERTNEIEKRFLLNRGSSIIRDSETNLEWLVGPDRHTTHYEALNWVESLSNGWRLSSKAELNELYNSGICDKTWGPFKNRGYMIWTKAVKPDDSSLAWYVDFFNGNELCDDRGNEFSKRAFAVRPQLSG